MLPVVHPHRCFHFWSLIEPLHSTTKSIKHNPCSSVTSSQVRHLSVAAVCEFLIHPKSFRFVQWTYTFYEIWIESVVLLTVILGWGRASWALIGQKSRWARKKWARASEIILTGRWGGLPYTHVQVCLKTIVRCWSFCNHSSCSYRLLWNPFLTCFQSTIGNGFQSLSSVRKKHWEVRLKLS